MVFSKYVYLNCKNKGKFLYCTISTAYNAQNILHLIYTQLFNKLSFTNNRNTNKSSCNAHATMPRNAIIHLNDVGCFI